jgi:DNA polymerase-1
MEFVQVKAVANYACEDADLTFRLAGVLAEKIESAQLTKLMQELELPFINVLMAMEKAGVYVDGEMLKEMSVTLGEQIKTQEEEIYKTAGETFKIGNPKQLGEILFNKLGLPNQGMTSTGQYKTGEEVLEILAPQHPLPRMILDYRQFTKLKNTYVDMLPTMAGPDGRIHASFSQIGSETGRLASRDPNLQNIPVRSELGRSIRAAFKPKAPQGVKGKFKILAADYSQIELRMLAHYSLDPVLKEGFARGVDVHTAVAARIFGVKEEDVNREQRARAKTVNFGVLYGQTAFGLSQTLSIPKKEASVIIQRFFDGHPKVRVCLDQIIAEADEKGYVSTILGRRRFVPQLKEKSTRKLGERIAVNTVFQGSAADLIKKAMLEIQTALNEDTDLQARMILQIHDELLFECPEKSVPALTKLVKGKMEDALKLKVPLVVETGAGDDWLSAKD